VLNSLTINNIVIINKAEISFGAGLCVLTGETGSGKSILLDALGLAIGLRSTSRLIGSDNNKAEVSAEFYIKDNDFCNKILDENSLIDHDNSQTLRIRRIIGDNSTSKVFVNDMSVGVNLLAKIGETLVEIHGQHDQHNLLNSKSHLTILDDFSINSQLLLKLKQKYQELKIIDEKIEEINRQKQQAIREYDYLTHVVEELENADVKVNEEKNLIEAKDQFNAQEKIVNFLSDFKNNLGEALNYQLSAQKVFSRNHNLIDNYLKDYKDFFEKFADDFDKQINFTDSSVSNLNSLIKKINNHDFNREEIEERLFLIRNLARKFNVKSEELFSIIDESKAKLKLIDNSKQTFANLELQRKEAFLSYQKTAQELSKKRQNTAKILAKKVEDELQFLKMNDTKFRVDFINLNEKNNEKNSAEIDKNNTETESTDNNLTYSINGLDRIKFVASTNNNAFDDITKIASGGELSRFMLALKVALIDVKSTPTMIFDEIDTGISGSTAEAVGKRLKTLANNFQILVVTHQAQIASKADTHYKISKQISQNSASKKVNTVIEKLSIEQSEQEIARMLSGEVISDEAILVAKNLRNSLST
jgi:DNA repair protein RecN (Recombination protein N)